MEGLDVGDAFLVYGPVGCQRCRACSRGQDTYCENAATMPYMGVGLGRDGGMAEYVRVPARNLVPLGDADPVAAASLSDAGLTPITPSSCAAQEPTAAASTPSSSAWAGWELGVQILKALTVATIIATDMRLRGAMAEAEEAGCHHSARGRGQVESIREITGRGVDSAFDFVAALKHNHPAAMSSMAPRAAARSSDRRSSL